MAFKWFGDLLRIYNTARTAYTQIANDGTNMTVSGGVNVSGGLIVDTSTLVVDAANNRVGIGTATVGTILQIGSTVGTAQSNYIYMGTEGGDVGYYTTGLKFRMHTDSYGFDILNVNNATVSLQGLNIVRHYNDATGVSALFIQQSTGDVTIAANLNVSGTYVTLPGGCRDWGKRAAAPTSPAPVEGDRFWNSTTHAISYYNGSTWS